MTGYLLSLRRRYEARSCAGSTLLPGHIARCRSKNRGGRGCVAKHHTTTTTAAATLLPILTSITCPLRRRDGRRAGTRRPKPPPDPRLEVEVPSRGKETEPQHQLRAVDDHAQDVELGLEEDGQQREQVAGGVDADKDEGYPADGPVQVDVPVVAQHARCQQGGREGGHQNRRPGEVRLVPGGTEGEDEGDLDGGHQSGQGHHDGHAAGQAPVLIECVR